MPSCRRRVLPFVASLAVLAPVVRAQQPAVPPRIAGAMVSGVVRDSIARAPLAGAWVQLAAADGAMTSARTVLSDSLGRYAFDDVPDGRYALGFFHPMLDSLGVEAPLKEVHVVRRRSARADLGIPSPTSLRAAICGSRPNRAPGAVVIGVVRTARGRAAAAGVTVSVEWLEISFQRKTLGNRRSRLAVTTAANGWFAICDVPRAGTVFLGARRGDEGTDLIEIDMPAEGFARRELYLGATRTVVLGDTASVADTLAAPPVRLRVGDGRLRGRVVTVDGNRPLAGALVRIADGPMVVADERGEWTLADAPAGSRVLEVRAVGFFPARRAVDVVADAPPVTVALSTFKAMLDTVRVTVARVADRHNSGFEERRRTGVGNYLNSADIMRRGALYTSDIFRQLRGVKLGYVYDTIATDLNQTVPVDSINTVDRRILMRGIAGNWCLPAIYIDGLYFAEFNADALDGWVNPERLAGIEIYSEATVPPMYVRTRNGCGAILFWTK